MNFIAKVEKSNLVFEAPIRVSNYLFGLKGTKLEVEIVKQRSKRSTRQNAYMWYIVYKMISDFTGHTPDEVHGMMKYKFLSVKGDMPYVKSTTQLNTTEMEEYLENIRRWAATALDLFIPDPNEEI
jgi:hypothetical protein